MDNIMLDLETLGTKPGCVVLSIGAVFFDENGLGETFYAVLNVADCQALGAFVQADTLAWWLRQEPAAQAALTQALTGENEALSLALLRFAAFCFKGGENVKVWGNGAGFDMPLLMAIYEAARIPLPWKFFNERCYRTLKSLRPAVRMARTGAHHNALDDARTQAEHTVRLLRALAEKDLGKLDAPG